MKLFFKGLRGGVPIGLGYLSVSFTFGIMAISLGFAPWQAVVISALTLTSAGQLAGIGVMVSPGQYLTMLISQLTINVRYSFMSVSLSQRVSPKFKGILRWIFGFFMTDEIFAVASTEKCVTPSFFAGLCVFPWIGWTLGTLLGSLIGGVLPTVIVSSLCIAIYGMFLAIIIPPARKSRSIFFVIALAAIIHCAFYYLPLLREIPSGISISISSILAASVGAVFFPIPNEKREVNEND